MKSVDVGDNDEDTNDDNDDNYDMDGDPQKWINYSLRTLVIVGIMPDASCMIETTKAVYVRTANKILVRIYKICNMPGEFKTGM